MWVTLLYNWVVLLVIYFSAEGSLAEVFWCSVYVGLGAPGAWRLWYRTIYYATRDDSSRQWIMFFANFIAHLGYCAVMVIGERRAAAARPLRPALTARARHSELCECGLLQDG